MTANPPARFSLRLGPLTGVVVIQLLVVACHREAKQTSDSQPASEVSLSSNAPLSASRQTPEPIPKEMPAFDTNRAMAMIPQDRLFTPTQVKELESAAESQGGLDAALKLTEYYSFVNYDIQKTVKYLKIAATNGHAVSQFNLGMVFSTVPQVRDMDAAKKWFEAAARSDLPEAKERLRLLESPLH